MLPTDELAKKILDEFSNNPNTISEFIDFDAQEKFKEIIQAKDAGASEEQTEADAGLLLGQVLGGMLTKMLITQEAILEELRKTNEFLQYRR